MNPILLDLNSYGKYARRSFVADFIEVTAWRRLVRIAEVADLLADRDQRLPLEQFVDLESIEPQDGGAEDSEPARTDRGETQRRAQEDARLVFDIIQQRSRVLGSLYPYVVDASEVRRSIRTVGGYDVALSLTLRHAVHSDIDVANEFEDYVTACLTAQRWIVFPLGARIRSMKGAQARKFGRAIAMARKALSLPARGVGRVPRKVQDRGADLLARIPPADARTGCRTFIVQATVGSSESWYGKLLETHDSDWSEYIGDPLRPLVTLAIPYHAEREYLEMLVKNGNNRTVWDRLRLVAHNPPLSDPVFQRAREVLEVGAEW